MSEPDLSHLLPEFRAQALLPDAERVVRIRSERWVDHPAALDVLGQLQEIAEQPPRGRMLNALLTAAPGMGKTMTLKKLVRDNAKMFNDKTGIEPCPVLYMLMPPVPTEEEFFGQVFGALGTPAITYHSAPAPARRGVPVTARVRHAHADHRRTELGAGGIAAPAARVFAAAALPFERARHRADLRRRAGNPAGVADRPAIAQPLHRGRLPPWQDGEDLRLFLGRLVQSLPLRQPSPVNSPALRRLVAARSAGLTWTICKAFERAAVAAIVSGRERLDRRASRTRRPGED